MGRILTKAVQFYREDGHKVMYRPGDEVAEQDEEFIGDHCFEPSDRFRGGSGESTAYTYDGITVEVPIDPETHAPDYEAVVKRDLIVVCRARGIELAQSDSSKAAVAQKLRTQDDEEMKRG